MADIVERLRGYASDDHERGCQGRYYTCSCGYDDKRDPLLTEAAYEIERLRAALEKIECYEDREWITRSGEAPTEVQYLCSIARAALPREVK